MGAPNNRPWFAPERSLEWAATLGDRQLVEKADLVMPRQDGGSDDSLQKDGGARKVKDRDPRHGASHRLEVRARGWVGRGITTQQHKRLTIPKVS
jgi:hypothetical protein